MYQTTKAPRLFAKAAISLILVLLTLFVPIAETAAGCVSLSSVTASAATAYTYTYYPKYTGKSGSIVTALKAVKVDSSYSNRAKIAKLNGITNYKGTANQNVTLLNLLKKGKLIKTKEAVVETTKTTTTTKTTYYPKYTGKSGSIVTALNAVKVDSSYSNRAKIAKVNGITNYKGTANQNITLLNLLKKGKLIKSVTTVSTGTTTQPSASSGTTSKPAASAGSTTQSPTASSSSAAKEKTKAIQLATVAQLKTAFKKKLGSDLWLDQHSTVYKGRTGKYYKQSGNCMALAQAVGVYLLTGKVNKPTVYAPSNLEACQWSHIDKNVKTGNSASIAKAAYENLKKGRPTMINYYSANAPKGHWVTVIGVKGGVALDKLKATDLIVYNPAGATEGSINTKADDFSFARYMLMK